MARERHYARVAIIANSSSGIPPFALSRHAHETQRRPAGGPRRTGIRAPEITAVVSMLRTEFLVRRFTVLFDCGAACA